jgi:hypothetical protein
MPLFTLPGNSDLAQIAIFNVLDDAYMGGMSTSQVGSLNRKALQAAVDTAQGAGGGVILIPSINNRPYRINGQITIGSNLSPPSAISLIFAGSAQGEVGQATLVKVQDDGVTPDNTDLFVIDTGIVMGAKDLGGTTFQNLQIAYISGSTAGAAIHVMGAQNVRVQRVVFTDCPKSVWFEGSLQGSMFECTAVNDVNPGTVVTLGDTNTQTSQGLETYIAGCSFRTNSHSGTAVQLYSAEHLRMVNTRIDGYLHGILITPGIQMVMGQTEFHGNIKKCHFENVSCFPFNDPLHPAPSTEGVGLSIQPANGRYVEELWFANCEFTPPEAGTAYAGAGILVDPVNGPGGGGLIDQVRFVDCYSCLWHGPGMNIVGGSNIEILGGYYSCNGVPPIPPLSPLAGIALTMSASGVRITGAACNNSVSVRGVMQASSQEIGVYIAGSSSSVRIQGCDLTGNLQYGAQVLGPSSGTSLPTNVFIRDCDFSNSATALHVSGLVSNVQVTTCVGYNDQATPLSTAAPSGPFNGLTYGYYGPVAFYASGGTNVTVQVDGHTTGLVSGGFTLAPGESAAFVVGIGGHLPTTFFIVGK